MNNSWKRLFIYFILWILVSSVFYVLIVLPFYPEALYQTHQEYEKMYHDNAWFPVLSNLAIFLGTLVSFWYVRQKIENAPLFSILNFSFLGFSQGTLLGFMIVMICLLSLIFLNLISLTFLYVTNLPFLTVIYLMVAISEEVFCRGYLLNNLMEKMPKNLAILVSSVLFSLMHFANPHFGFIGFVNIFLSGVLMANVYLRSGDLSIPIGFHFSWNLTQAVFGIAVSGQSDVGVFLLNYNSLNTNLTGGQFGLEGSILLTPIILIAIFLLSKDYYLITQKRI